MLNSLKKMFAGSGPAPYHRRWPRIVMSEPARLIVRNGESRNAVLDQISAGGARVKVAQKLQPGAVIGLDFKTSPSDHHTLHARVVHVLKEERGFSWHCGLCFVDADTRELQRIEAFVEAERKRREVGFAMPRT
jgi:PilZ domain